MKNKITKKEIRKEVKVTRKGFNTFTYKFEAFGISAEAGGFAPEGLMTVYDYVDFFSKPEHHIRKGVTNKENFVETIYEYLNNR